eukprot:5097273-Ditylum_brightwellii.AAC.1
MHGKNGGSRSEEESKKESESSESDKEEDEDEEEEETLIIHSEVGKDVSKETENTGEFNAKTQKEESPPQTKKTMLMAMQTRKQKLPQQRQSAHSTEELQPGENESKQE